MRLSPRYDGPSILVIPGAADEALVPTVRQRRRMQTTLATLTPEQWLEQSRCSEWSVRDVVVHLIGVNQFWQASILAARSGTPTRFLESFDPAATPLLMVSALQATPLDEVLQQFIASNDGFIAALESLTTADWSERAEAPPGHIPIRLLTMHALWDAWIHERDIGLPLGLSCAVENDEVALCLRYAASLSPALAICFGIETGGTFGVSASTPDITFELVVSNDVVLQDGAVEGVEIPRLSGDAVLLVEAVSLRAPLPESTPQSWRSLMAGLSAAFDAPQEMVR